MTSARTSSRDGRTARDEDRRQIFELSNSELPRHHRNAARWGRRDQRGRLDEIERGQSLREQPAHRVSDDEWPPEGARRERGVFHVIVDRYAADLGVRPAARPPSQVQRDRRETARGE